MTRFLTVSEALECLENREEEDLEIVVRPPDDIRNTTDEENLDGEEELADVAGELDVHSKPQEED